MCPYVVAERRLDGTVAMWIWVRERWELGREGWHLLAGFQHHLTQRPANCRIADCIDTAERGQLLRYFAEVLMVSFLARFIHFMRRPVPTGVDDARHADSFVQDIDDPSSFEALHL